MFEEFRDMEPLVSAGTAACHVEDDLDVISVKPLGKLLVDRQRNDVAQLTQRLPHTSQMQVGSSAVAEGSRRVMSDADSRHSGQIRRLPTSSGRHDTAEHA